MAKSTRSKVKRAFRAKKRTEGTFAAAEAARLQRLNAKLRALTTATTATSGGEGDSGREKETAKTSEEGEQPDVVDMLAEDTDADADEETVSPSTEDGTTSEKKTAGKISTHGPRASRRERWRVSKGMAPRPKSRGMNRQGGIASRYESGRSHRRR